MTTATIIKKIRLRIYQLQRDYNVLCDICDARVPNENFETEKLEIATEIDKLQTMLMAINEIW